MGCVNKIMKHGRSSADGDCESIARGPKHGRVVTRVLVCALAALALAVREFRGQISYEWYRQHGQDGFEWARLPAQGDPKSCSAARPARIELDALMSFWTENPAASNASNSWTRMFTGGAGKSELYPSLQRTTEANHRIAAAQLGVPYVLDPGTGTARHGPGMHAICSRTRALGRALNDPNVVRHNRWIMWLDADAAFKCSSVRPPTCQRTLSAKPAHRSSRIGGNATQRPHPRVTRCMASALSQHLEALQRQAWLQRGADPSMIMFSRFGSFAVRSDVWTRSFFAAFTAAMETRPLLCWLSTVSDVAAFFGVIRGIEHAECHVLYSPSSEGRHILHLGSQGAKHDRKQVYGFQHAVDVESASCARPPGPATPAELSDADRTAGNAIRRGVTD